MTTDTKHAQAMLNRLPDPLPHHARGVTVAYLRVKVVCASDAPGDVAVAMVTSVDKRGQPVNGPETRQVYYVPYDELIPARVVGEEMGVTQ